MRKPRQLSVGELAPYQWQMPRTPRVMRSVGVGTIPLPPDGVPEAAVSPEANLPERIDWARLFSNSNPVEIEVGMGKGLFFLTSAQARPDTNFFGIEIARKYQLYATTRLAIRKLTNAKTVCADARWVLQRFVPPGSVSAVHVYFPDPWWKARHKKRRVFSAGFAEDAAAALAPGGILHIATDVEEYFGVMTGIVRSITAFRELKSETSTEPVETAGYQTNFERKARQKGTPVWRASWKKG